MLCRWNDFCLQQGRKQYGKRKKCLLPTFSPFPKSLSIGCFFKVKGELVQTQNIFRNSVNPFPHMPILASSTSAANKYMMSKVLTNGDTVF